MVPMTVRVLGDDELDPRAVVELGSGESRVALSQASRDLMHTTNRVVAEAARHRPVYGRTTGVGANHDLGSEDPELERRLLASHATTGLVPYPREVVRSGLVIRANQLARGGAGVTPAVADAVLDLVNGPELPTLHRGAALGTGDLGALAQLGLALGDALADGGVLALLSSNAFTLAECCVVLEETRRLIAVAPAVGALTLVAMHGHPEVYDARVHAARPHPGQAQVAARMRELLDGWPGVPARVQDPFGLRALAQVLGPAVELADALEETLRTDINAAAENPLVTPDGVIHNGNWHAMPVALRVDALRLSLHSVGTLSTSRLANLIDPDLTGLSRFLAEGPSPSSGALMLEYVAHDALAEVRAAAQPATLGTATLSRGAEHHASFAPQSAALTAQLLEHLRTVLACELVAACRALALAGTTPDDLRPAGLARWLAHAQQRLPRDLSDRPLRDDIDVARELIADWGERDPG